MSAASHHRRRRGCFKLLLLVVIVLGIGAFFGNRWLTTWVEGEGFRQAMSEEASKGLNFTGEFESIRRTGFLTAMATGFQASEGTKAFGKVEASDIHAKFNPLGFFLRRWQFEYLRIGRGTAEIQIYTPHPEPAPAKPWFAMFMPDRVYLNQVTSPEADVVWAYRDSEAGFYGLTLLITPHGRDFEYHATGGELRMAPLPRMELVKTHLLITREQISLYQLELKEDAGGRLSLKGNAGLMGNRVVDATMTFDGLDVEAWIPEHWKGHFSGNSSGQVTLKATDLEATQSSGTATVRMDQARLVDVPFLAQAAEITGVDTLTEIDFSEFSVTVSWEYPHADLQEIHIGSDGVFQITGQIQIEDGNLSGEVQLGLASKYLDWLPRAKTEIFTRDEGGYLWTPVQLSGTLEHPDQDLSPRIMHAVTHSPGVVLKLVGRKIGNWFSHLTEGEHEAVAPARRRHGPHRH